MSETKEDPSRVEPSRSEPKAEFTTPSTHTSTKDEKGPSKDVKEDITTEDEEIVYPTGLVLAAIVLALCLAVFLVALDQTIIATAIPRITDKFHSVKDIGWYGAVRP